MVTMMSAMNMPGPGVKPPGSISGWYRARLRVTMRSAAIRSRCGTASPPPCASSQTMDKRQLVKPLQVGPGCGHNVKALAAGTNRNQKSA